MLNKILRPEAYARHAIASFRVRWSKTYAPASLKKGCGRGVVMTMVGALFLTLDFFPRLGIILTKSKGSVHVKGL